MQKMTVAEGNRAFRKVVNVKEEAETFEQKLEKDRPLKRL